MYQVWGTTRRREKGLAIKKKTPDSSVGEMYRKTATNGRPWEGMDGGCPEDAAGRLRGCKGLLLSVCLDKKGTALQAETRAEHSREKGKKDCLAWMEG